MSAPINDGGPAFPVPPPIAETDGVMMQWRHAEGGMSLRDWFAGQMLAGEFVQNEYAGHYSNECPQKTLVDRAQLLYRMADAMLEARKGGQGV